MWPQCGAGRGMQHSARMRSQAMSASGASQAEITVLSTIHRAHFGGRAVDNGHNRRLYKRSWRAAACAMARAKPLTVYAVNHPAISYGHVGCAGFGGSGACRRRGREVPGCLKRESEERETWTAESLRAASPNGEGIGLRAWAFSARERPWKRLRRSYVSRFSTSADRASDRTCRDLVKRCDQPRSNLFNLRV
jgi:hypothetical protein